MKTITKKLQLITLCGALLASTSLAPKNAPAGMFGIPPQIQRDLQNLAHQALYNVQERQIPQQKPRVLKILSLNIYYAYAITDIIFYGLNRQEQSKTLLECHRHLKEVLHVTTLGFVKEVVLRMLWDLDKKKTAVILHLFLQNLCWLKKQPKQNGIKSRYAESSFKTVVPILLILAQKIRRQHEH